MIAYLIRRALYALPIMLGVAFPLFMVHIARVIRWSRSCRRMPRPTCKSS
jgi:hypothetical protein